MRKIYSAPISSPSETTLRARGSEWEDFALELRDKEDTYYSGVLLAALPPTFSRNEFVSITVPTKNARKLLELAGLSS